LTGRTRLDARRHRDSRSGANNRQVTISGDIQFATDELTPRLATRFIVMEPPVDTPPDALAIVTSWTTLLKK